MKLIDKDALVAEIERLYEGHTSKEYRDEAALVLEDLEDFIDTLEVKKVDLEKEIDDAFLENKCNITDNVSLGEFERIAKHFFELGMAVSNKEQKGEEV